MATRFKKYIRDTGAFGLTSIDLINWRAILGTSNEWLLAGLNGFILSWHDYGFPGVPSEVVALLAGWRIQGNERGAAVTSGCPETGPLTDLEVAAILDWANAAVTKGNVQLEDYAYLLTLIFTARRPVQIAALRGKDLAKDTENGLAQFSLNIPRAKQRGGGFRREFRRLPIPEDLYLVLHEQHRRSVSAIEHATASPMQATAAAEIPIFINDRILSDRPDDAAISAALHGEAPDRLHATTAQLSEALRRISRASHARSERTGEFIRLTATRFRHTRGTKLRREGFDGIFDNRLAASRTRGVAEANANPPLGLFGCSEADGSLKWAASVMPGPYGGNAFLYLKIRPVTYEFLAEIRSKKQETLRKVQQEQQERKARNDAAKRKEVAENARLEPWRRNLKVGDQTSCGMVIDVRGPLVEVQLPRYMVPPDGPPRVWLYRSQLSDQYAGSNCQTGG